MARLIDADALKANIEQSGGEGTIARYCKRVLAECLDIDAPTIEAIPVRWLNDMIVVLSLDHVVLIDWLICEWQKEQEVR